MTVNQVLGNMTSIRRRLRNISAEYDRLDNAVEAKNVVEAALHEMTALHNMLPMSFQKKSWVFLSLERGRTHYAIKS